MHDYKNIDCLQYLKTLPDESVDMVLTDPPYFLGYDGGKGWDSQWSSEKDYLDWCESWTKECFRTNNKIRICCHIILFNRWAALQLQPHRS